MNKIFFVNDTSKYHGGSFAVCNYFSELFKKNNYLVQAETKNWDHDMKAISESNIIFINGEGTLHGYGKKRVDYIFRIIEEAISIKKYICLANTSLYSLPQKFHHLLRSIDEICVRETFSYEYAKSLGCTNLSLAPDASLFYGKDKFSNQHIEIFSHKCKKIGVTDFYSRDFGCFVKINGGSLNKNAKYIDMRSLSWNELLGVTQKIDFCICGRFHGLMALIINKIPFAATPGNTAKIEGFLHTILDDRYKILMVRPKDILGLNCKEFAEKNSNLYHTITDWLSEQEPWIPRFIESLD